jgi:hypothetical protein
MTGLANFSELASVKGNQVEKPKPAPIGHYSAMFAGPVVRKDAKSGNFGMEFPIKLTEAHDDVDAELLAATNKWNEKTLKIVFWMSEDARWRFTEFAKAVGIDVDDLNLVEIAEKLLEEKPPFMVEIKHRQDENDPTTFYAEVQNPSALPA